MRKFLQHSMKIALFACIFVFVLSSVPLNTYAASKSNGWLNNGGRNWRVYGTNSYDGVDENDDADKDPGILDKYIGGLLYNVGNVILNKFLVTSDMDLSIDGVVLGRMGSNTSVSYTRFELEKGNPYGIVGAWIYVSIRMVVFSLFLIYFVAVLLTQLLHNGNKGRAELKEFLYNTIFFYALMYFLPYIIDYIIYAFDVLLYVITNNFSNASGKAGATVGVMEVWKQNYLDNPSLVFAFLYLATVFAGLFFFSNYVGTALIQTILFGAIPAVCLVGARNKKIVTSWSGTFFPNLMIPLIDGILLMIPAMLSWVFQQNTGAGASATASIAITTIQLIAIWAIIPSRNAILHALGALTGVGAPKSGLMGLAALGLMAARGLSSGGKRVIGGNKSGSGEKESYHDSMEKAKNEEATGEIYRDANQQLDRNTMEDINTIFSKEDSSGGFSSDGGDDIDSILASGGSGGLGSSDGIGDSDDSDITMNGTSNNMTSLGGLSDIGMDEEFASELGNSDMGRYANLSARDAMSEELELNKSQLNESGFDSNAAYTERTELENRNRSIDDEIASIHSERDRMMQSAEEVDIAKSAGLKSREEALMSEKVSNSEKLNEIKKNQNLESRNRQLEAGIKDCDKRELSYASASDMAGMSGKRFNSAADFKAQYQVDDNRKKMANYKNFDSGNFDKLLSPEEKAKFTRERAIKEMVNPKKIAGTAAGVAVGVTAAAAMTYGGPQSMMMGAVGGYMAGHKASDMAIEAPGHVRNAAEYAAPKVSQAVKAVQEVPSHTANKFVRSSARPASQQNTQHMQMAQPAHTMQPRRYEDSSNQMLNKSATSKYGAEYADFSNNVRKFDEDFNKKHGL